jgi:hypothetical protein
MKYQGSSVSLNERATNSQLLKEVSDFVSKTVGGFFCFFKLFLLGHEKY